MALPGTGYRNVLSVALEMSLHLVEPYVNTTLTSPVAGDGVTPMVVTLASLGYPVNAVYVGALLVVDVGDNQETITITAVNSSANQITAIFQYTHAAGTVVQGATFPTQAQSGDPFFTQSEILADIARAQHEFLVQVPCVFAINTQMVEIGNIYQDLECDAIEMHRVSASNVANPIIAASRISNIVTAQTANPHGLVVGRKFAIFDTPDLSFIGVFTVATVPDTTHFTYTQIAPNASMHPVGGWVGLWVRLYELTQEQLYMQNPGWRNQFINNLASWYEDRTGRYRFGLNGKPAAAVPIEVLVSIRDTNTMEFTDGFLVPDLLVHYVKYKALEYVWSKDGEQRNPLLAGYASMRFARGVLATRRWMQWSGAGQEAIPVDTMGAQGMFAMKK